MVGGNCCLCFFGFSGYISIVTVIFTICFIFLPYKKPFFDFCQPSTKKSSQQSVSTTTERLLNRPEQPQPKLEEIINEEEFRFIACKMTIWDFFGISQSTNLAYSKEEKSKMFIEYYQKLVSKYFNNGVKKI